LSRETAERAGPEDTAAVAGRVFRRLRGNLALWFGAEGFDALLLRAMDRANNAHPARDDRASPGPGALDALAERARSQPPAEADEATVAVLATFISLLGRLVGNDLAERLIEQSWPGEARSNEQRFEQ
jgi:hypothetical protein